MRLAIIADIHGNYRALLAVLADIAALGAEAVYSLGDNIGYGPEPEEVVQTLRAQGVVSVMGNHELALVSHSYLGRLNPTAKASIIQTRSLLSSASLHWLAELPLFLVRGRCRLVHGCPPESATVYLYNPTDSRLQRLFAAYPEQFCFAGHTHDFGWYQLLGEQIVRAAIKPGLRVVDPQSRYLILPGSVGQPRDEENWHAKYLFWDQEEAVMEVRALAYDVRTTVRLLGERGFPMINARRLGG